VIDGAATEPKLAAFNPGTDQFPDRSTTVIVQCAGAVRRPGRQPLRPRHPGSRNIAPQGLRTGFWAEVAANAERSTRSASICSRMQRA
jgi:alpha-D-ribose 1-methylphosphonate 5-triphosphate synthase subunit PhnH